MVRISCQDVIVGKFCSCIFPSCHDLFLVQISCQYHVWLCGYINNCSWKFRKIQACGKNAAVLSILLLYRPRTQEKDDVGVLNSHTHNPSHGNFLLGISPWNHCFQKSDTFPEGGKPIRLISARFFGAEISKRKCPFF